MLVQNNLPSKQSNLRVIKNRSFLRHPDNKELKNKPHSLKRGNLSSSTLVVSQINKNKPFWLKSMMVMENASSLLCYVSVAIALVMYGMTVYAPKQWTEKYHQLQDLQKQERQFSFTDEIIKNQLAESASESGSGLVNPDPTKPPIFLPNITHKSIVLKSSNIPEPKQIDKISPIAY